MAMQALQGTAKQLARHEHELAFIRENNARVAVKQEAAKFATAELATIDTYLASLRGQHAQQHREWFGREPQTDTPHPIAEHERSAALGRWGARCLLGFEIAFAAWLTARFNFSQHLWRAMGVTAALWLAASSGLARMLATILKRRSEVPQETRARVHKTLTWALPVWLVCAALMLIMRTAQGKIAVGLSNAAPITLALWAIDTIILAGCGICADRLFRWSGDASHDYYAAARLRARVAHLLSRCEEPVEDAGRAPVLAGMAAKLAVALLAITLGGAATARAQTAGGHANEAGCTFIDQTPSVDQSGLSSALKQQKDVLPAVVAQAHLASWCFVPFSANAWTAEPIATVTAGAQAQPCAMPALSETDALFTGAREERLKKARAACAAEAAKSEKKVRAAFASAVESLEQIKPARTRCSSVLDAVERAAKSPLSYAVLVTDGGENCGAWRAISAPGHPLQLLVVLLPSTADEKAGVSPAVLFERRKAELMRAAPWISAVVPTWGLTPELFRQDSGDALRASGR